MKIMVLESDLEEQEIISQMLTQYCSCNIEYRTSVNKAINSLGLSHCDLVFVDADCKCDWKELVSFLDSINIKYSVFSSNGKVGMKNGLKIVSIDDLHKEVELAV